MGFLDDLLRGAQDKASRAYDQVNPMDNGKNWNQRTAKKKTTKQPSQAQMFLEELPKAANTVGSAIGRATLGNGSKLINQGLGVTENLGANVLGEFQKATGNKALGEQTIRDMKAHVDNQLLKQGAGLFGTGGIYNSTDSLHNANPRDVAIRSGGTGLATLAETLPVGAGAKVLKGTSPLFSKFAQGTALGLGQGAAFSAGSQLSNTGQIQGDQFALDTALGGLVGGSIPLAVKGAQAAGTGAKTAKKMADVKHRETLLNGLGEQVPTSNVRIDDIMPTTGRPLDPEKVKFYEKEILNGRVKPLIATVDNQGRTIIQDGETRLQALKNVNADWVPVKTLTKAQIRSGKSGGYAQIPSMKSKLSAEKAANLEQSPLPSVSKSQLPVASSTSTVKLNTKRLDVTDEARVRLDKETTETIDKLTNDDVRSLAKSADIDMKSYGIEKTKKKIAEQLNLRNEIATVEKQVQAAQKAGNTAEVERLMGEAANLGRISRTQGTDLGRQLAARRIIADQLATPQQKLYRLFDEAGVDQDAYIKRLANVDMANADEVVKAYRDLVPAKFTDWLDKYRYTNMLSSPLTHIVNVSSNLMGLGGVAPVEKLFAGAADATKSALTGKARTRYASEAGAYYVGAAKSLPEALKRFSDVLTGKQAMDMPDADSLKYGKLAHGGIAGTADTVLSIVPKLLEASDQFGMTLSKGGEKAGLLKRQSKGIDLPKDLDGAVDDAAKYRVFRQELGKDGQGAVLGAIDAIPQQIMSLRNHKSKTVSTIAKFTIPFVTTPANLFKQGIEYSPLGIATLPGHADKTGQVAKMAMGSTVVALSAAALATKDAITFSEPSDAKQRDAFRAEGKQSYAIKIGDKWVNYSKLHPAISFNLAVVGAVKEAQDKGAIDQKQSEKIMNMAGGVMGYFRDQSYMKAVGDFTANLEMKDGADATALISSTVSNWGNQLSPFKSMVSWIGRQIDPTQRKTDYKAEVPEQIYQNLIKDIPGLNNRVPVRENPYFPDSKEAIKNDNPILNSFSPVRITNDKGYGNTTGLNVTERREQSKLSDFEKPAFRQAKIDEKYAKKIADKAKEDGDTTSKSASTSNVKVNEGLDKESTSTLNSYKDMTVADRDKKFYKESDAEYKYAKAKYENDKASGTLSRVDRIKREDNLAKLEVGSKFTKDTRDLYTLSKTQLTSLIDKGEIDEKQAEQILAYGDALATTGSTNRFRDSKGNVAIRPKAKGGVGNRGGKGKKATIPKGDDNSSTVSFLGKMNRKVASAKVAKKQLPTGGGQITARGIKAYKKVAKTNVSKTRRA